MKHSSKKTMQFIKYTLASGVAFVFDFAILYALVTFFYTYYLIAAALSFICGLLVCYLLSLYFVFDKKFSYFDFTLFSIIGVICAFLNVGLIWFFTDIAGVFYIYSKILAVPFTLLSNFFLRKTFVFDKCYNWTDLKLRCGYGFKKLL